MLFGDRVRELAEARGLNASAVSELAGISKQNMSKIWNNRTTDPRLETVIRLAEALNVDFMELVDGVEFPD